MGGLFEPTVVEIDVRKHTLANGLDVLLHENHDRPLVGVNLWYHVGSKNDEPGRTGFAHFFEHLMFEGSAHHAGGYFQPLVAAGAALNGSTNADRTNYWETVPTGALELALWMESERMGSLLPALTEKKFSTQREVILNERRQTYENRPYGLAPLALRAALFPGGHPYGWPTIGRIADVAAARLDDVHEFFRRHYHPANASLAVAGDFDSERALALVERCFCDVPAGPAVEPVRAEAALPGQVRLYLEDRVELPRLYIGWLTTALFAKGDAEIDLAVDLLTNGVSSRLHRRLMVETPMATQINGAHVSRELTSFFELAVTSKPESSLADIHQAVIDEVAKLAEEGPSAAELESAIAQAHLLFLRQFQHVGGFGGKADQLNGYNTYTGNPAFVAADLQRYADVTAASLAATVTTYLRTPRCVLLSVVPPGQRARALPGSSPADLP